MGVTFKYLTDMEKPAESHGLTATVLETTPLYRDHLKRALDIALVLLVAPIALPLILVAAALAAMDGGSPFYWQDRVGLGGRSFRMLKIRTMVPNAKARLESYLAGNPEARREWDHSQKLKHDPRITRLGYFLRKTSLDELPQLWNVLKGDMSIVGPRPMMVEQKPLYEGHAYYAMRPGITGFWQVSDRNETSFVARARYDTDYYHSVSLATDIAVLVRTVAVVLRGTGY